ncbi:MAG: FAD-binding oxidoreductase [Deltaproteobacteria bacterium]|nr:FAD-binding oxidoreductase [Deltaproteobacteria bacterium]
MSRHPLEPALEAAVGADHVLFGKRALMQIAGKAAGDIEPPAPTWVVQPASAAEVADVLRACSRERVMVVPWGTGSTHALHARDERTRVVLDMRRMTNVLHLDETSLVVHAQAGLTARTLEELLIPRGLTLGDFPPAALGSTLGGLLSARGAGRLTPRHGFLEDACLGVSAVLADGRTIHTRVAPRRATGPDLSRVLMGSEGTLGIITGVVLRIDRRPESRLYGAHAFPPTLDNPVAAAIEAVKRALAEDARPTAMGVYDPAALAAHYGAEAVPGDLAGGCVLVTATAGLVDLAAADLAIIGDAAAAGGAQPLGPALAETWWTMRARAYGMGYAAAAPLPPGSDARRSALEAAKLGGPGAAGTLAPVDLEVYARLDDLPRLYATGVAHIRAQGAEPRAHIGRFDSAGGILFLAGAPALDQAAREKLADVLAPLGARRARATFGDPALAKYLHDLKRELDPHGILNPDRAPPRAEAA